MSDYRVSIRFRNARLLRAIESAGYKPGQKFSEIIGVSYASLLGYLNLTRAPFDDNGDLRQCAEKISVFLHKMPVDLWSEEQRTPLKRNTAEQEVSAWQISKLLNCIPERITDPLENLERTEAMECVDRALDYLTPREAEVLRSRFGFDDEAKSLHQASEEQGCSVLRIRQIEQKALRKLRNTNRSDLREASNKLGIHVHSFGCDE